MSLRPQAPINTNITPNTRQSKPRARSASRKPSSRSRSISTRQKPTPSTNKSFAYHKQTPRAQASSKNRSFSVERSKQISKPEPSPTNRNNSFRARRLRSTSKLVSGHPGPGDIEDANEQKREILQAWFESAVNSLKNQDYSEALGLYKRILTEEPSNPEALYKKSLCLIYLNRHKEAVPSLLTLTRDYPHFNKEMYTALAMSFIAVGDYSTAIKQISRGLIKFPKYIEGYISRGEMYNYEQKWDKAIIDFYKAISLNPGEGGSYLGLADSLVGMGDKKNALKILVEATQSPSTSSQAYVRRASIQLDLQHYDQALDDLGKALKASPDNAETYYYAALAYLAKENWTDAALELEEVIKYDTADRKFTGAAIYNLGVVKIRQRDFYGATYTFKRASDLNLELPEQKVLKSYVEAILFLMKRHFEEGVDRLTKIIKKKDPILEEYLGNCYAYRAYGLASLEKHHEAIKDFSISVKMQGLDFASEYNFLISQGIVLSETEPETALEIFVKASQAFPKNIEPYAYQAAVLLEMAQEKNSKQNSLKAKALLDQAIEIREEDSDLHYFRAIVNYYNGKPIEAVPDLEIAIDKAEDNMPVHFLAKGLCYANLKLYKEAIHDFSIALQLDENYGDAYFYRGRCAFILEDSNLAFSDYEKLIMAKADDPEVHVHAGDLLILIGSIEDALKAYNNANQTKETSRAYIEQAECYLELNELSKAIQAINSAVKIEPSCELQFDKLILDTLSNSHERENLQGSLKQANSQLLRASKVSKYGKICEMKDLHWYKGVFHFFLGDFQDALSEFKQAIGKQELAEIMKNSSGEDYNLDAQNAELLYNLSICYLMQNEYEAALLHLSELVEYLDDNDKGKLLILISLLHSALDQYKEAKSIMEEAAHYDQESVSLYLESSSTLKLLPLNSVSKFALTFPMAKVQIRDCNSILLRPSFGFPAMKYPDLDFNCESGILKTFAVKSVKCKPEAPWLNRVKGAIEFTEDLEDIVSEDVSESEESKKVSEQEESESEYDMSDPRGFRSAGDLISGVNFNQPDFF